MNGLSEKEILELWRKHQCFEQSVTASEGKEPYIFYDGPPFATGKPHYGHILTGTMKDVITRYQSMKGKHVPRKFGWDCHGLPVETIVDTRFGFKAEVDLATYNQECRKVVMQCEKDWEYTVERMGRWIDFQNSYKTMDLSYMNGLWNIFHQLQQKGLIYQGWKVMPFSLALGTPLSHSEANLNYKQVSQTDAYVLFPLVSDPTTFLIAWTTTPWTLLSHVALCVHPHKTYIVYHEPSSGRNYIVSQEFPVPKGKEWVLQRTTLGEEWKGAAYDAPFSYVPREYQVLCDPYVKDNVGTGVIHLAPSFGEDDDRICRAAGISPDTFPCPLTPQGIFTETVGEFAGLSVHEAEKPILKAVQQQGRLWKQGTIVHSYPHCWRTDTPLIYRSVRSWFLRVESIKEHCIVQNKKVQWVPAHLGVQRFQNWLEQAKDWALSRTRSWGTPIPVWVSDDGEEQVFVSSKEELEALTGTHLSDLHRESVDALKIPSRQGKGFLTRIPEVFDCWYESGAVPILQGAGPADFVAEGLDQTRGWFYTMLVLYTALYEAPPYKHVLCSGMVLAADGKKMSKRLQNYPDPLDIMERYGADALRMYLLDSPVVKGETLRFQEEGVYAIAKEILTPLRNAGIFWETYAAPPMAPRTSWDDFDPVRLQSPMDRWIIHTLHVYLDNMHTALQSYELWNLVSYTRAYVDRCTNTYIRWNRSRWKRETPDEEACLTLTYVLTFTAEILAPLAPFLAEAMYPRIPPSSSDATFVSVHSRILRDVSCSYKMEAEELSRMEVFLRIGELTRKLRVQHKIPLKQPLSCVKIVTSHSRPSLQEILLQEINVEEIVWEPDQETCLTKTLLPHLPKLGKRFGKRAPEILATIEQGILPEGVEVGTEVTYHYAWKAPEEEGWVRDIDHALGLGVCLHISRTDRLKEEGEMREYLALVYRIRKDHQKKAMDRGRIRVTPMSKQELLQARVGEKTLLVFDLEHPTPYQYGSVFMEWQE